MIKDIITPEASVALVCAILGLLLGYIIAFMDHVEGYDAGWHKGVEDVMEIINLWEEE